jgi:hypothetical protein
MNWIQCSSSSQISPPIPSSPLLPTERKSKWRFFIVPTIIFILIVAAIGFSSYLFLIHPSSTGNASSRATFSQYGMSIQYPSNAQMQVEGVPKQDKANASDGAITWIWNSGDTSLVLSWVNSSTMNYNIGFNSAFSGLQGRYQNVSIIGTGSTSFGGENWQYQTYKFDSNGVTYYVTYAACTYLSEHRLYLLGFLDTANTTLNSLDDWGNTFHG